MVKRFLLTLLLSIVAPSSFAATIGYDGVVDGTWGSYTAPSSDPHYLGYDASETRVAVVGERVTEVGTYFPGVWAAGEQIEVGVYRKDTLALVGSAVVERTGSSQRVVTAVDWALTAGVEYAVAFRYVTATVHTARKYIASGFARLSAATGASPLADPFVINASTGNRYPMFATTSVPSTIVCNPISGRCGPAAAPITQ